MARPPGPPLPALVQSALFSARPVAFLDACRRRYGGVFQLRIVPFGRLTYLADPAAIKEVFTGDVGVFRAGEANQFMRPTLGGASLLLLDGDEHLRTRKLMLPAFHGAAVRRYAGVMADVAGEEVERWPVGRPFAVRSSMQRITLEVILRTVFGLAEGERLLRLRELLTALMNQNPAYLWFEWMRVDLGPRSPFGRFLRLRDRVDAILFDEIARRRRDPRLEDRVDVLSLLLRAGLPDGALRDELMTLLLAGHETTATGLAWACERLARHPEVAARAREDDDYLEATVKEVLRIRPVVLDVARVVAGPARVAGFDIEPGTMVAPAITTVQRAGDIWPDAEAFRPERFLRAVEPPTAEGGQAGDRVCGSPAPYSWIPFGGGVRRCLGAAFAQLEIEVVLRAVLERVELGAPPGRGAEAQRLWHVTLVPDGGGEVVVSAPAQRAGRVAHADDARGDAGDDGVVGDVLGDDGARADHAVVADGDAA
ncbi:MAG: cytochrome P450 [Solirubrobacterales bacterium]